MMRKLINIEDLDRSPEHTAVIWRTEAVFNHRYAGLIVKTRHGEGLLWSADIDAGRHLTYRPYADRTYSIMIRGYPMSPLRNTHNTVHQFKVHIVEPKEDGFYSDYIEYASLSPAIMERLRWIVSEEFTKVRRENL